VRSVTGPLSAEETPTEFSRRMGISLNTFSRKVRRPDCPQNFEATEGPSGRFKSLRASPELEQFMRTDPRRLRKENGNAGAKT
jgi:hypothetical protein